MMPRRYPEQSGRTIEAAAINEVGGLLHHIRFAQLTEFYWINCR